MHLNKYETQFKHALALVREREELSKKKWGIVPIKLDKPIQHGFVRSLELRDDVKYRKDYVKIKEVIDFIGQRKAYHHSEDFMIKTRKSKHEKHAHLKSVLDPRFKFYFSDEKRQADLDKIATMLKYLDIHRTLFECNCESEKNCLPQHFRVHYTFSYPWMLQEVTKPHFLTHYTPVDNEIESRLKEIDQEMYSNNYYKLLEHRRVYDKLYKEQYTQFKYGKDNNVIYHALNEIVCD